MESKTLNELAELIGAELVVLLTDIAGLFDADPESGDVIVAAGNEFLVESIEVEEAACIAPR